MYFLFHLMNSLLSGPSVVHVDSGCGARGQDETQAAGGMLECWWQWLHCGPAAGEGRVAFSGNSHRQASGECVLWLQVVAVDGGAYPQGACECV